MQEESQNPNPRFLGRVKGFYVKTPLDAGLHASTKYGSPQENNPVCITILGDSGIRKSVLLNAILQGDIPVSQEHCTNTPGDTLFPENNQKESIIPFKAEHTFVVSNKFYSQLHSYTEGYLRNLTLLEKSSPPGQTSFNHEHSFLFPESDVLKPTIHLKYAATTRIIVTYPTAESLKESLFRIKKTTIRTFGQPKEKNLRSQYIKKFVHHPKFIIWSRPEKIQIKDEHTRLLGKTVQYKALGQNFQLCDRYFIRETLREIYDGIGCFAENITIHMPLSLLQQNIQLSISDSDSIFYKDRAVCRTNIDRSDIVIVVTDSSGSMSEGTKKLLASCPRFFANLSNSKDYQLIFAPTQIGEKSTFAESSCHSSETIESSFTFMKELLPEDILYDNVKDFVSILPLYPLMYAALSLKNSGCTRGGPSTLPKSQREIQKSNIPHLLSLIKIKEIIKSATPLSYGLHMWIKRKPRLGAFDTGDKVDLHISRISQVLDQWSKELKDIHKKFKLDHFMVLQASISCTLAREAFPKFQRTIINNPNARNIIFNKDHTAALEADLARFACQKLLSEATAWWGRIVLLEIPKIFHTFGNMSEQLMRECTLVIENSTKIPLKQYCERVIAFWRSEERHTDTMDATSLPTIVRRFKRLVYDNAENIVNQACISSVHTLITEIGSQQPIQSVAEYLLLVERQIPAIPIRSATKITQGFMNLLSTAAKELTLIQQSLLELQVRDSYDGHICTILPSQTYQILCKQWRVQQYGSSSSWKDFIKTQLREKRFLDYVPQVRRTQFHAVGHQIYGKESSHDVVRILALHEIITHPERYTPHLKSDTPDLNEYITKMSSDLENGDHITLHAIANAFHVNILMYSPLLPKNPIRIESKETAILDIRVGYLNQHQYHSLVPWKEDIAISNPNNNMERFPAHMKAREPKKRQRYGSTNSVVKVLIPTLVRKCIIQIVHSMDLLPILEGALPEELVQPIITELIAQGKLNGIVLQKLLHESITRLDLSNSRINNQICADVSSFCPHLCEISLANCSNISSEGVQVIARNCSALEVIDVAHCNIEDAAVSDLVRLCKNLISINLDGCTRVSPKEMQNISRCPNLQTLSFKSCPQLTEDVFESLSKKLEELDLSECSITDSVVLKIATNECSLKSFKLSGKEITDESLSHFVNTFPGLEQLHLNGCDKISDAFVRHLATGCKQLTMLDLSSCANITPKAFRGTPENHLSNLKSLNLSSCDKITDEALLFISVSCPELSDLNISGCEQITDCGLKEIGNCHSLRKLDVSLVSNITDVSVFKIANGCPRLTSVSFCRSKVTNQSIMALTNRCRRIKEIDLSACENITDEACKQFALGFPKLEVVKMKQVSSVTSVTMSHLAACPRLVELHLSRCSAITAAGLLEVAQGCPMIHTLDISHSNLLSISDIQSALSQWTGLRVLYLTHYSKFETTDRISHQNLTELHLCWSTTFSDENLIHLANTCPRLHKVNLAWCGKISENSIQTLLRKCPIGWINIRGTKISRSAAAQLTSYCSVLF